MRVLSAILICVLLAACSPSMDAASADKASEPAGAAESAHSLAASSIGPVVLGGVNLGEPITLVGAEPLWNIGFGDGKVVFTSPGSHLGRITSEPFVFDQDGAEWHGKGMDIYLTAVRCSDGMSDRGYPLRAVVHIGESKLRGCAASTITLHKS